MLYVLSQSDISIASLFKAYLHIATIMPHSIL